MYKSQNFLPFVHLESQSGSVTWCLMQAHTGTQYTRAHLLETHVSYCVVWRKRALWFAQEHILSDLIHATHVRIHMLV